jgi:NDP-4-keto-2,6-dideoxyhexose 3-C-methyltransferase
MWGKYWYRSGINHSMKMELKSIVDEITKRIKLTDNDVWLDIACNDGTMFSFIPNNLIKLGIDPCDDSYYQESSKLAHCVIQEYFSKEAFQKTPYKDRMCKVVTSIAMFYDLEKPAQFISDIYDILEDDGVWVMQLSYTPLMIEQVAFDNICHEHTYYHSLNSIKILAEQQNMKVVDAEVNDANGGSIRVYIQKQIAKPQSFGNAHLRDVCKFRINSLLNYEDSKVDISDPNIWIEFHKKIDLLKKETVDFIRSEKAKGKIIAGYGASTKGNTLLQYFGLDSNDISFIAERSERKYGLLTVGTNIPIISEDEMRQRKPDYLLVLPWTFINEFIEREQEFLNQGGKFIVPCPQFEIIGK